MASFEQQRNDIAETVLDLAKGFAILARAAGPNLSGTHAFDLQAILQSILARAQRCEWDDTADIVRDTERAVGRQTR